MTDGVTMILQKHLDRFRAGDAAARDALIERACTRLQSLAHHMMSRNPRVRRFADTDDLVQFGALRLMRSLQARPPDTVADFFRLSALEMRHALIDLARKHLGPLGAGANEQPVCQDSTASTFAPAVAVKADSGDPGKLAFWTEFHQAVEKLDAEQRAVFELLWYHNLTREEAAEVLGWSLSTVKRRWLEARLNLQDAFPALMPQ